MANVLRSEDEFKNSLSTAIGITEAGPLGLAGSGRGKHRDCSQQNQTSDSVPKQFPIADGRVEFVSWRTESRSFKLRDPA